jgi:molybdopterin/thiamine biosynthesis adenylyltransferase
MSLLANQGGLNREEPSRPHWDYVQAFARNQGLITAAEQEKLRTTRVAIIGMGGVGGIHLATLARLGIGRFHIADPDRFELANFNRQYGARVSTLGRNKAEVMAEHARDINPEIQVRVFTEAVTPVNIHDFLDRVDVVVDGVDFFAIQTRRLLYSEARQRGLWVITAGPLGFSTVWLSFSPKGMTFDQYFDVNDSMDFLSQMVAFAVGLAPRATHLSYMDLSQVDISSGRGPSAGLACHLCSGVVGAEVLKVLLGRGTLKPAPFYFQFDAYRQIFRHGRLYMGNRHPLQRLKRWLFQKRLQRRLPQGQFAKGPNPD